MDSQSRLVDSWSLLMGLYECEHTISGDLGKLRAHP